MIVVFVDYLQEQVCCFLLFGLYKNQQYTLGAIH